MVLPNSNLKKVHPEENNDDLKASDAPEAEKSENLEVVGNSEVTIDSTVLDLGNAPQNREVVEEENTDEILTRLKLDKHQHLSILTVLGGGVLLLTSGAFLEDWIGTELTLSTGAGFFGLIASVLQLISFFSVLFANYEAYSLINGSSTICSLSAIILAIASTVLYNFPSIFGQRIRFIAFIFTHSLNLILVPVGTWFVFLWTIYYKYF